MTGPVSEYKTESDGGGHAISTFDLQKHTDTHHSHTQWELGPIFFSIESDIELEEVGLVCRDVGTCAHHLTKLISD